MSTPRRLQQPAEPWGTRLQNRRCTLGITQVQLAGLAGITQQSISRIENNEVIPRITTLEVLARALGTSVEELFPIDSRPRVQS